MTLVAARIDDRLIHGQVIIGWGRPLQVDKIVLVDDSVAVSDWEKSIYQTAVPEGMEVVFSTVTTAMASVPRWRDESSRVLVLTGDIQTMARLWRAAPTALGTITIGGLHHRSGRRQHLTYVYLDDAEVKLLGDLAEEGAEIVARDLPASNAVALADLL